MTDPLRVLILDDDFRVGELHRGIVDEQPGYTALDPVRSIAEVLQEPIDMGWGQRDCAFRDPSGNMVRIAQAPAA